MSNLIHFLDWSFDTDLKNMGWSVKDGAEDSLAIPSSLLDVEKPLWLRPLWADTEIIGAGSWLLPVCLEKLQEISGGATFFVETQTAAEQSINSWCEVLRVMGIFMHLLIIYFTFLIWWWEKFHFSSETSEEVLQEEQCVLRRNKNQAVIIEADVRLSRPSFWQMWV